MSSKITNLNELESILSDNKKINEGVLHFVSVFKIKQVFKSLDVLKNKGLNVSVLLFSLIMFRLLGESISRTIERGINFLPKIDDNTFYRLMNNSKMNWRKLLLNFAKQFEVHVMQKGDENKDVKCFVIDDTDIQKTGKTIEFIGRIFSHVTRLYPLGYKLLLLGFWDGKSLISVDFSLHREKGKKGNYGLTTKEQKNQFSKKRDHKTPSYIRVKELDISKIENAITMIKRALKNGFTASYVLMDSWFVNDYIIKSIRSLKKGILHILGLCKIDNRKYLVNEKKLNAHQLIVKYERKLGKYSRKYKSHYISIIADYKGETVKLFFIKYNNSKNYTLLLTTDLRLSFVKAIELYQIRWTIEVLFKECKQYLKLGSSQNTDFDGQIADITLTLITHTILSLQKRFSDYETMGSLFRESQKYLLELTLWKRLIKLLLNLLTQLMEVLNIDMEETIKKLLQNNKTNRQLLAFLNLLNDFDNNSTNSNNLDSITALAS